MRYAGGNAAALRGLRQTQKICIRFSKLDGTRFNLQIELTTKNTFKRQHDSQMIEFVVFNSVFGKWRSQLIDVPFEKP